MNTNPQSSVVERPTVVLIMAVLTLIWSALTLLGGLVSTDGLFPSVGANAPVSPEWINWSTMGAAVVKGIGAVLLLGMRKMGFFVYLAGELVTVFLNLMSGMALYAWAQESASNSTPIDPVILILGLTGVMIALSVVWIGAFAVHLSKMR